MQWLEIPNFNFVITVVTELSIHLPSGTSSHPITSVGGVLQIQAEAADRVGEKCDTTLSCSIKRFIFQQIVSKARATRPQVAFHPDSNAPPALPPAAFVATSLSNPIIS
jgi:hypothetical protein